MKCLNIDNKISATGIRTAEMCTRIKQTKCSDDQLKHVKESQKQSKIFEL